MIQLLRKRRSQWLQDSQQEISESDIIRKQQVISCQEQLNKQFWQEKCKLLNRRSNLYQAERKIDLDQYQEKDFDEKDIIVIPRAIKKPQVINLDDSVGQDDNIIILDEAIEPIQIENNENNLEIEKINGNNLNINLDQDREGQCDIMINETFQIIKDNDEVKLIDDQNASQDTTVFHKTIAQHFIAERKQGIFDKQLQIDDGNNQSQNAIIQLPPVQQIEIVKAIISDKAQQNDRQQLDITVIDLNKQLVSSSNNLNEQPQKSITIDDDNKISEEQNKIDQEYQEDEENQIWYLLKNPRQTPISFFADWKFKGIDKINLEGRKYEAQDIFKKLFTQSMYNHLIQSTQNKFIKRQAKHFSNEEPMEINSYDIDAFISLLLHSQCLTYPNHMNTMRKNNEDMDINVLDYLQRYFTIGSKAQQENGVRDEMSKIESFVSMANQNFKQILQPKEYLQLTQKTMEGNYFKSNSQYFLDELRLYESSNQYIIDIKFDKNTPPQKNQQDYVQKLMRIQADILDQYKNKAHKVVIQNQLFDADILRSLRNQNIGVVTKSHIDNIQFTPTQLKMITENKFHKNFFFIYEREVQAVITPYSFSHKYAFISNFLGLEKSQDLANPKMKGVILDYKDINSRDVEGVKWEHLVFLRILDAIVKNTHSLYQYVNNDSQISREQIVKELKKSFLQSYQANRELKHKISQQKISTSKDFRMHFYEEIQGGKKQECVVCHTKTKNYCIQCSEKKKTIIGFCGSPSCMQKHNELPAKLLNQQAENIVADKKKNPYDKPYESATESGGGFKNKFGFRPLENNSSKLISKKLDGYQSEAQISTIKQRNFSIFQHDDGFKSDAGSSSHFFSGKKKSNGQYTFKTTHQLAKEHESQFSSNKNLASNFGESVSLADEIMNVYQKKKTASSNNLEKNSQEPSNFSQTEDKNQISGGEKISAPLKPREFSQLRSKGSLSDIEQVSHKNLDISTRERDHHNKEKKKRHSKVPWYNTEEQEEEDRREKEKDYQKAKQIFQNPKVKDLLTKEFQNGIKKNKQHQGNPQNSQQHSSKWMEKQKNNNVDNLKHKKQMFRFEEEEEDDDNDLIKKSNYQGLKSQNPEEQKIKNELHNSQQIIQATPTLGQNLSMTFSATNVAKDANKNYQFEEEEDIDVETNIVQQTVKEQPKSQQQFISNSLQDGQIKKVNTLEQQNSQGINSSSNQQKNSGEKEKPSTYGFISSLLSSSSEMKGKTIEGTQKTKTISREKGEGAITGLIKVQKESIQRNSEDLQNSILNLANKEDQPQKTTEISLNEISTSKVDIVSSEITQKNKRTVIRAVRIQNSQKPI